LRDPILKNPITKNWAGGVAQDEGPGFKPQYHQKKKKMKSRELYAMICLSSRTPENLGAKTQRSRGQGKREKH
jgi:hypothetical protein